MFSVVILTLNEERNLPLCLASTAGCDDVVILDSGSTDRTAEIARTAGARVFVRAFDNFAGQRNFAQTEIPFAHSWVFHLDADEQLTPSLVEACRVMSQRTDLDGAYVAPKMMFMGRWIPHCTDYPAWQARFVRAPQFRFIEVGHGQREAPGMRLAYLQEGYLHDLSASGEADWLEKHRRYARAEARTHQGDVSGIPWRNLFSGDALLRRRALKRASHALPCRGAFRFIYQYVLRGGFLDGRAGLRYCQLLARYEGFVSEERRKLRSPAA
jgi:glycosyltransferase involved in cell wall biosynthesis